MTWYITDQDDDGTATSYRGFFSDESISENHLDTIRKNGVTAVTLWGKATAGRSSNRLAFLGDLPQVVYWELWNIGAATLPKPALARLEVLTLAGRYKTVVDPVDLPELRSFAGRADRLAPGRFGRKLRWLTIDKWSGSELFDLPLNSEVEYLSVQCEGQVVSFRGVDTPLLEILEIKDVEVESLEGLDGAPRLKTLSLLPPGDGPSSLREIDLRPLVGCGDLRWLRLGRQGRMTHFEALAGLKHLQQVGGYASFFDPRHLDAVWADPLPDSRRVKDLLSRVE